MRRKEVQTSNFNPQDLLLIIEFIENNLDESIFDSPKVQKSRFNGLDTMGCGNQGLNHENRLKAP